MRWSLRSLLYCCVAAVLLALFIWHQLFRYADPSPINGRLPNHVRPLHYDVQLTLLPDVEDFSGITTIELQLDQRIDALTLHAQQLRFSRIESSDDLQNWHPANAVEESEDGLTRIQLSRSLAPGTAHVRLSYQGRYTANQEGLWRQQINGDWYVFNQFNTIFARRAIPGFDEPGIRARIDLSVTAPTWHHVVSTTSLLETSVLGNGRKRVHFVRTPPISLHQLNISVGPFDIVAGPILKPNEFRRQNLPIRAVTVKGQGARSQFALAHIGPMVEAAENYFGMPFPFEKLDVLAVPHATEGVLEHPGAINLRDRLMLFDQHNLATSQRFFLSYFTHGLLHHWVGNLVAMEWWNDVWIYEGVVEWLTYRLLHERYPALGFDIERQQNKQQAIQIDLNEVRRLQPGVIDSSKEIHASYSAQATLKSASLIHMLERFIREDRFQSGFRAFFARHAYDLAGTEELYHAVTDSVAHPLLASEFDRFINEPGVPLIHFERQCQNNRLSLLLRQNILPTAQTMQTAWTIPVCARFHDQQNALQCQVINQSEQLWQTAQPCEAVVLPNADGAGYYRWSLATDEWQRLITGSAHYSSVEALEMAENLAQSYRQQQLPSEPFWQLAARLSSQSAAVVTESFIDEAQFALYRLSRDAKATRQQLRERFAGAAQPWTPTIREWMALDLRLPLLREQLLQTMPKPKAFTDRSLNSDPVRVAVWLETQPEHIDSVLNHLCRENQGDIRNDLVQAIGNVRRPEVHAIMIDKLSHPCLSSNEQWRLLNDWLQHPPTQFATFSYLRNHFPAIRERQPTFRIADLPPMLAQFCDADIWAQAKTFLLEHTADIVGHLDAILSAEQQTQRCIEMKAAFTERALSTQQP